MIWQRPRFPPLVRRHRAHLRTLRDHFIEADDSILPRLIWIIFVFFRAGSSRNDRTSETESRSDGDEEKRRGETRRPFWIRFQIGDAWNQRSNVGKVTTTTGKHEKPLNSVRCREKMCVFVCVFFSKNKIEDENRTSERDREKKTTWKGNFGENEIRWRWEKKKEKKKNEGEVVTRPAGGSVGFVAILFFYVCF